MKQKQPINMGPFRQEFWIFEVGSRPQGYLAMCCDAPRRNPRLQPIPALLSRTDVLLYIIANHSHLSQIRPDRIACGAFNSLVIFCTQTGRTERSFCIRESTRSADPQSPTASRLLIIILALRAKHNCLSVTSFCASRLFVSASS